MALPNNPVVQPLTAGSMPADVLALQPTFNTALQGAVNAYPSRWNKIAQKVPVGQSNKLILAFVNRTLAPRLWIGPRNVNQVVVDSIEITPALYELTVGIDQLQYEDTGNLGHYLSAIGGVMGAQLAAFYDKLCALALQSGTTVVTNVDNQPFFYDTHPVNPQDPSLFGTQSNYKASGYPLNPDNVAFAIAALKSTLGVDGQPLGAGEHGMLTLVIPPGLEFAASQLIHSTMFTRTFPTSGGATPGGSPETNTFLANIAEIVVLPQLNNEPGAWYLLDNKTPGVAPFAIGERKAPVIVPKISPTDENVYSRHWLEWGADFRVAVSPVLYWFAAKYVA